MQPITIEAYSRDIRRIADYFDGHLDDLSQEQLLDYFHDLLDRLSWSAVKLDLYSLYRALFVHHVESDLLKEIRSSTNKGLAIAGDCFKNEIEVLTGRRLKAKKVGRPIGWRKKREGV